MSDPPAAPEFARALLGWYADHRRDLPWRRDPEPWRVLVAETMLQQTRIAAVTPRYESFLARFPAPEALAAADEDEVLALWSGLGYYRRARNLRAAAREIVARHGGRVPEDAKALRALPGVGAYTAGAVLSIAFGRPEPIVDGNVERVLARVHRLRGSVKRNPTKRRLWEIAEELVRSGPPAELNQALMELGALVCLPRAPRCGDCPLAGSCGAHAAGREEELPELPAKRAPVDVTLAVALIERNGAAVLVRAPAGDFLAGTWGPPFVRVSEGEEPAAALAAGLRNRLGREVVVGAHLGTVKHGITHHRIEAEVHRCRIEDDGLPDGAELVTRETVASYGLSSLARKSLRLQAW